MRRHLSRSTAASALALSGLVPCLAAQPASEIGSWSGVVDWPIEAIHSVMLPTGKVMVWQTWTDSIALWDPADGSFTDAANPNVNIFCSGHAWLPDGRLLVVGGHISNFNGEEETNIYDPWTDTWANNVPDMNALNGLPDNQAGRWYPAVTSLGSGEVLTLAGDMTQAGVTNPLPQVYSPQSNSWRDLTTAVKTDLPEYPRVFTAPDGRAFVVSDYSDKSYLLDTTGTGAWTYVDQTPDAQPHSYGSGVMYDTGKVAYFGGGFSPTANISTIDLNDPSPLWSTEAAMAQPRRQNDATILADGTVLISGGTSEPGFNDPAGSIAVPEIWDPLTNTVTPVAEASSVYRGYHSTATLLPDGRVLITGGDHDDGGFTSNLNAEIYSPAYLSKGPRPTVTAAPSTATLGDTIFIETPDAASITRAMMIVPGSTTHSQNWAQRANVLEVSVAAGGVHIDLPGNPHAAPPGQYMLFLINGQGVPSVGEWLRTESDGPAPEFNHSLVGNGGFEAGEFTSLGGWNRFGNSIGNVGGSGSHFKEGDRALKLFGQFNGNPSSGAGQGISITEGVSLRFVASAFTPSDDSLAGTSNELRMKIEFFSEFGALFGSEHFLGQISEVIVDGNTAEDVWFDHVIEAVAPEGAVEARVVLAFRQPGNEGGAVWVDEVGLFFNDTLPGDYNGDGLVSQADLDLVLLNWGDDHLPAGFDGRALPEGGAFDGLLGQNELNGVLLNWGDGVPPVLSIPEPLSAVALATLAPLGLGRRRGS
ncbi:MAG: galactose oxidase-like domain-containing protein [Planctomycetota bacterium]